MLEIHVRDNVVRPSVQRNGWFLRLTIAPEMSVFDALEECRDDIINAVTEMYTSLFADRHIKRDFSPLENGFAVRPTEISP
jgi:hypothetical protein